MIRALVAAVFVAGGVVAAADQARDGARQAPAIGTAQITGTVMMQGETPMPLRRAAVTLTGDQAGVRLVAVTDDAGVFAFTSLPGGRYSLVAAKAGYVPMSFGSKRPGGAGTPVFVAEGAVASAEVALPKGSVLTGTVRDEFGRPAPGVTVTALRFRISAQTGERTLQGAVMGSAGQVVPGYSPDAFPGTAVTDDRGDYRIYGLAAGEYVVSASARRPLDNPLVSTEVHQTTAADVQRAQQLLQGSSVGSVAPVPPTSRNTGGPSRIDFVPVYHPSSTARSDAATITLGVGEERAGIDVSLRMVPTATVYGEVLAPDGSPVGGVQVAVMDPISTSGGVFRTMRSGVDGEFALGGIPPGRYLVQAAAYPSGDSAQVEILVDGRDVPAPLTLVPGVSVSGRIVFDGTTPPPPSNTVLTLLWRRPQPIFGGYGVDHLPGGGLVLSRVPAGRYTLRINGRPPAGWILRSVMLNGVDVSDIPFEVRPHEDIDGFVLTLTDRPAEISGTLQTTTGEPAPGYVLVVFSADSQYWVPGTRRTQQVRPDVAGRFVARDLPAGDYLIAAVTDLEDGQWHDRAFLAELAASGAIKITLAEGDRKVQDIRIR